MNKYSFCILLFIYSSLEGYGQSEFRAGTSNVSIEPPHTIFSLALGGYGAPSEGRFTLTWLPVSGGVNLKVIAGHDGILFAVNEQDELIGGVVSDNEVLWRKYGSASGIFSLAGIGNKLYGVDDKEQLMEADISKSNCVWRKIGSAKNIMALAALDGNLYAASNDNKLFVKDRGNKVGPWKMVGTIHKVFSLTEHDGLLYSANPDSTIWKGKVTGTDTGWIKIARKNGLTYNINVRILAVLNDRLYALNDEGKLYAAGHSTTGDLSARALAVTASEKTAVIVGVDLCSFNYSLIRDVKNIIWERRRIPPSAILINASHTHFAPTMKQAFAYESFMHEPDSVYRKFVRNRVVKAIELALDNMEPARLSFGRGMTQIGRNRSSKNENAPYDNAVDVINVESINKKKRSVLFLTGCHPVFRNAGDEGFTISANYPGITRRLLEEKGGIDNAIFIQGCGGDINPRDNDHEKTGLKLTVDVMAALNKDMKSVTGNISYSLDTVGISIEPWSLGKIIKFKQANSGKGDLDSKKDVRWAEFMIEQYERRTVPSQWPVYIQTINIGNWKLVGLSREVVTEYSLAIKALWPDKLVSVAGYSNDVSSYLPASRHINQKTYEGYNSFFWNTQPAILPADVFDLVIGNVKRLNR